MLDTELSGGNAGTETEVKVVETTETKEGEQTPEKPKVPGFKRKLERKEAELAAERATSQRLSQELEALKGPKKSEPEGKPQPKEGEAYAEYYERLADWTVDQKITAKERKERDTAIQAERTQKVDAYKAEADKVREKYPDFDEVVESYPDVPQKVLDALLDSTPEVAYYLAKHEDEAEDIVKMTPVQIHKAFARIEAKLETTTAKGTKAPKPINPVGGGSSRTMKALGEMNFQEYKKAKAGK